MLYCRNLRQLNLPFRERFHDRVNRLDVDDRPRCPGVHILARHDLDHILIGQVPDNDVDHVVLTKLLYHRHTAMVPVSDLWLTVSQAAEDIAPVVGTIHRPLQLFNLLPVDRISVDVPEWIRLDVFQSEFHFVVFHCWFLRFLSADRPRFKIVGGDA